MMPPSLRLAYHCNAHGALGGRWYIKTMLPEYIGYGSSLCSILNGVQKKGLSKRVGTAI